jgi:hypothetical protein
MPRNKHGPEPARWGRTPANALRTLSAEMTGTPVARPSASASMLLPLPISPPTAMTGGASDRVPAKARASAKSVRASSAFRTTLSGGVDGSAARKAATFPRTQARYPA